MADLLEPYQGRIDKLTSQLYQGREYRIMLAAICKDHGGSISITEDMVNSLLTLEPVLKIWRNDFGNWTVEVVE